MKKFILSYLLVLSAFVGVAQDEEFDDAKTIYRRAYSGGITLHPQGFGLNFRYRRKITYFKKFLISADLTSTKHPKEQKTTSSNSSSGKGYVFGKLNSLFLLRPSIGVEKIIFSKETKKGVQISYTYQIGPTVGILKPIYLEIITIDSPNILSTERYDPSRHTQNIINGGAPYLQGIDQLSFQLGGHAKFSFIFDYAPLDALIRNIEVGISADVFAKKVPMMAFIPNQNVFLMYYISFNFGKKLTE